MISKVLARTSLPILSFWSKTLLSMEYPMYSGYPQSQLINVYPSTWQRQAFDDKKNSNLLISFYFFLIQHWSCFSYSNKFLNTCILFFFFFTKSQALMWSTSTWNNLIRSFNKLGMLWLSRKLCLLCHLFCTESIRVPTSKQFLKLFKYTNKPPSTLHYSRVLNITILGWITK